MSGENLTLSYAGPSGQVFYHGKCVQIQHGMTIITEEDHGPITKALYTRQVQQDQFVVTTIHSSRPERDAFFAWIEGYGAWAGTWSNGAGPVPIHVQGPRGFDFYGIYSTGAVVSTQVKDVTWSMQLHFIGAWPANQPNFVDQSTYIPGGDINAAYYYPMGIQLSGAASAEDTLYSDPTIANPVPLSPSQPGVSGTNQRIRAV